ncbi:carboxypeptidase-like regulatory domain-containing protein [Maribacter algarum]|uniref:Carboxypeptidase-like regulatory domain-containing protein n=1 Tax=Maribacter algarum (ex Zhang et al. 2020) TaxID=2578118 RepID=A0A5S3PNR9_9FLAO|nr:carboxypeptidase-like regulatory domain-containing protein [Maribacter algarum]TMM56122.1 carboxypeptidase-like regulatory domain-containing protein [Maribacter algarum]
MKFALLFFFLSLSICFSQNQHEGFLLDSETKEPIEFVNIYNGKDFTISNEEGRYAFSTSLDSIVFYRIGYKTFKTTFDQLKDTLFLNKSVFELNEVVVTNAKTIYDRIKDSVATNYLLEPHTETFFLRTLLKKNNEIVRLQDVQGRLRRKTSIYAGNLELEKKDFEVEIQNMRKIGVSKDEDDTYFIFPSFHNIFKEFVRLNAMGPDFEVTEQPSVDELKTRVDFKSNLPETSGRTFGHYIINSLDNAILFFNAKVIPFHSEKEKSKRIESRLLENKVSIFFKEDPNIGLYFMNSGKREGKVEVSGPNNSYTNVYEMRIILTTSKSFGRNDIKSNVNEHKDIFKLKHRYNADYWNSQNQLLLTEEMQEFIKRMGEENKEFKVKSNMN